MAGSWFVSGNPMNQLGQTIGRSPNGQMLPSVAANAQQASNAANAAALEAYYAEERRRWDATYQQNQTRLDRDYEIQRQNAETAEEAAALDKWYKRESAALARERLREDKYQFEQTHALNQAKLGYDLVGTLAQMRGPDNYFQAANYARGVSGNPQTATFLTALQNNTGMSDFNAQGGLPDPVSYNSMVGRLTGQANPSDGNNLAAIGNIAAKGAHQLGAGSLERLTDTERKLFTSGLDSLGIDTPTFLNQYTRSRIGQGTAGSKVA